MKLLLVVTPPSIYYDCSTKKTFWEGKFALDEFTTAGMKKCGRQNIRKHMETDNGEKYITLEISLEFCNLDKMKITSLEPKYDLGRLGKGLNNYLGLKKIGSSKTKKKESDAITNVSMKDISKIIKEFEKFPL